MRKLVVATKNRKKLSEIKTLLKGLDLKIISLLDFSHPPSIKETGKTFKENAVKKAVTIARFSGLLTLGEDSGLQVKALGGRPGVYSSRFSGAKKDDVLNNEKVLRLLGRLPLTKRKARYVCSVALADEDGLITTKEGTCYGRITFYPKGTNGFGYDPIFIVKGFKKTFGQLSSATKHRLSHRGRALKKIKKDILAQIKNPHNSF